MYPEIAEMDFVCGCPIFMRKNVWHDGTGVHVRFCPMCNERRTSYYEPSVALDPRAPKHITGAKAKADAERDKMPVVPRAR